MKYSIEVFEDHAIVRGKLSIDDLQLILSFFRNNGYSHISGQGPERFKLIKTVKENVSDLE